MMHLSTITYEQPLAEHIRVCLRLEQLFQKIDALRTMNTRWAAQMAVSALIDILNLLDRPDLKPKLTKALTYLIDKFTAYRAIPQVDQLELDGVLRHLDVLLNYLINTNGKIGHALRSNELLAELKQHHGNFGGPLCMDTPAYHYWLQQPESYRERYLGYWFAQLAEIRDIMETILHLTRESQPFSIKMAEKGFYFESLDPKANCRLIRIAIPRAVEGVPEISVGRHRVNVRFRTPKSSEKARQIDHDVQFELACCT